MSAGRLVGIARRRQRRVPMDEIALGLISVESGLAGDYKGAKFPLRQITVLAREAWEAAAAQVGESSLPWTTRRANLLVEGVELPRAKGGLIGIGPVRLRSRARPTPASAWRKPGPGC